MWHGKMRVNGYRIGDFAYCTDTNYIPDSSLRKLRGVKTLILDALRFHPHPTHFTIGEALSLAKKIGAERTYFTHISCFIRHQYVSQILPSGVELCYDNLVINV
jgi:phosphoribosyl 1,2-cyclic phosphate phosphodiesterase